MLYFPSHVSLESALSYHGLIPEAVFQVGSATSALKAASGEGFRFSVQDKSGEAGAVKKAMIRAESIGKIPLLDLPFERDPRRLIKVKLEIDVNPPQGSIYETHDIAFPVTAALTTQSLESGFAMKIGAMLGRTYTKGRDFFLHHLGVLMGNLTFGRLET